MSSPKSTPTRGDHHLSVHVHEEQQEELTALVEWLATFPQLESHQLDKENAATAAGGECGGGGDGFHGSVHLSDESVESAILDVALEVCDLKGSSDTMRGHNDDVWDTILSLTRKCAPSLRKILVELPPNDGHHDTWEDQNKHLALSNLLSVAVSHRDLMLRKAYIERIMTLSTTTQRVLMSLIERRKSQTKTPSKKREGQSLKTTPSSTRSENKRPENRPTIDNDTSMMSLDDSTAIPIPPTGPSNPKNHQTDKDRRNNADDSTAAADSVQPSPFRLRRMNDSNNITRGTPPSKAGSVNPKSTTKLKRGGFLSTPNFMRRSSNQRSTDDDDDNNCDNGEDSRRTFHDAFGSPAQRRTAKRLPPPSSERSLQMNRSILSSPGLGGDAEYERVVEGMRDEIETLKKQLDLSQKKETELAHLIDEKEASFKKELIQVERNARHRYEEAQDEYEKQLTQIKGKLSQMSDELLTVCNERDELSKLRDEMDIMKHTKATLEETQERLNAYKERVHQLADIKSALKEEEEAHSRCVEDNLKLRNEIQTLLPLKKQLEEYQSRLADAEVQMTDYEDQLAKFKDQRLSSSDINEQMEQYVLAQEEELQELRRRVRLGEVSTESKESISFIGEGLSELNPELREELMKLRNDNEQLRLFREKRGDDNVSKLEQEVGDKTRLAERYKTQFLSTKDQLESTQRSLQDSRGREAKLRSDLAESLKKVQEAQGEVEDLSSQLHKVNEELSSSQQRESKLEDELSSWASEAKHLQEHSNDLSRRLKRHEDLLEDSLKREKGLATELDQVKAELEETIEENEALTEELEERTVQLQSSEKRENELSIDLKEWTKRAQESHDHMKEISAQLVQSSNDLKIVTEERSNIEARFTLFKEEAEEQISKLSEELRSTSTMLQETQKNIEDAKNREMSLQNEIADLTCRAEDAEGVSKQRMELLHTTREKLQSVESKLEEFEKIHQQTLASLASWTSRSKEAESKIRVLDDEIEELRRTSLDTEEKLAESQALSDHLRGEIVTLSQEKEDAMKQAGEAQALVDRLRVEVGETTNNLLQAREELKNLQLSEAKLTEQLYDTEKTLGNLENEIESQVAVREEVTKKFDTLKCEHAQLSEKWANEKKALSEDLESQRDQRNKLENELASANETLSELHVTLGSLHHREKMLKHDISKLTHKQQETEKKLSETESELLQVKEESAKSIENLEELLVTQSEEVIRKLKDNMNKLVEDERILKRQAEELYKHRLEEAHQEHQKSLDSVENKWREKIDHLRKETDTKINRMKAEYEDMIVELKKAAEEEKMSLMDQGKAMLKENKTKIQNLSDDVEYLESKILDLEEEKKKIVEGNERIGKQFQLKMGEYKKKLQEAASRNKILASNQDELKDKVTSLSREKIKLLEENDRYRRQLGGRSGTDSVLQSQLESVQKELYDADEENKELKRKLRNNGYNGLSSISEESTGYGLRSGAKHSTLAQQRAEYEETIMTLKDEMRGHVMEKTALITAAQAESKRAWEAEQQVSDLKKQATSLLLEKARLEKLIENRCPEDKKLDFASYPTIPEPPSQGNDNDSDDGGIGQHRADKSLSMLRSKTSMDDLPEKYAVAEQNEDDNDDENNQKLPFKSNIDTIKNVRSTRSLNSEPNNDWM